MKNNKCKLCEWIGRTHMHHIIPIRDNGKDEKENIVELCPNHHAEASENEEDFAKRFNLVGVKKSDEELSDLQEFSHLFHRYLLGENINNKRLKELKIKHNFDRIDMISYFVGITRKSVLDNYALKINNSEEV